MKVGILSMQRIQNYGSFLQAYGLKHILEDLGCEVQFVDYHPGKCLVTVKESPGWKRKFVKAWEALSYEAPMKEKIRFIRYKKNYATNYFPLLGITTERNYSPNVDVLVIGSDEVFNCIQDNPNVGYCPELFGAGANAKKVISYAASFGNTTLEKLQKFGVDTEVGKWLRDLDAVSVRDKNSAHIVEVLTGKTPECHLDPVLMYNFCGNREKKSTCVGNQKYMILYGYSGRFTKYECQRIRDYANRFGLKVICIGGVQDCCDKFVDCDPFEVISHFQHAECVVTDTFHGTILSVITHRQFVSVVRNCGYGNSEKLTDLLNKLELKGRVLTNFDKLEDLIDTPINYDTVDSVIQEEKEKTKAYLKNQLGL